MLTYDSDDEEGGIHGSWLIGRPEGPSSHATAGSKENEATKMVDPTKQEVRRSSQLCPLRLPCYMVEGERDRGPGPRMRI